MNFLAIKAAVLLALLLNAFSLSYASSNNKISSFLHKQLVQLVDWVVGDKTGTGAHYGTTNDLGIIWPPLCAPIVMGIYYTNNQVHAVKRDNLIAAVTRLLINELAQSDTCIEKNLRSK